MLWGVGAIVAAVDFYFFLTRPDRSKDEDGNPLGLSILPRRDLPAPRDHDNVADKPIEPADAEREV